MKTKIVIFSTCLVIVLLAVLCVTASGAVPSGASGVNFYPMSAGSYTIVARAYEDFDISNPDAGYMWESVLASRTGNYYLDIGGATLWDFSGTGSTGLGFPVYYAPRTENSIVIMQYLGESPLVVKDLFQHIQSGEHYTFSAWLELWSDYNGYSTGFPLTRAHFIMSNGNVITLSPEEFYTANQFTYQTEFIAVYYEFVIPEGTDINANNMQFRQCQLLQGVQTLDVEYANSTTTYVPYNGAWFGIEYPIQPPSEGYEDGYQDGLNEGYTTGYNEGYTEGAEQAGGTPIQRWGAFILTAVTGFFDFEIFPGFPLWGLLSAMVALPLLIAFLKMFAGG